ncbi:MAG: riboflavin synthase [Culturomica sp.]|jgi:riboflavin synthase|nr:riboflavin synthase [Culturomica sp.]
MFTGIIEEIGTVKRMTRGKRSVVLEIEAHKILEDTKIGDSISTNGVCLTVTELGADFFRADVMPETVSRSGLGEFRPGDRVNLERALTLKSRLGGHLVAGHVDGTGTITALERDDNAIGITIRTSPELLRYILEKGSIAVDGVSLTVVYADEAVFRVAVIPHTQTETTLTSRKPGDTVNIENDMIARYVEKLLGGNGKKNGLSLDFLQENGF